jgi:hypothetical protein
MPDMINPKKGIDLMNNNSIINRILFPVTIFQHGVLQSGIKARFQNLGLNGSLRSLKMFLERF